MFRQPKTDVKKTTRFTASVDLPEEAYVYGGIYGSSKLQWSGSSPRAIVEQIRYVMGAMQDLIDEMEGR